MASLFAFLQAASSSEEASTFTSSSRMSSSSESDNGRPAFPSYLLPSISFNSSKALPFRRRKSSTATNATVPSLSTSPSSPSWSAITTPSTSPLTESPFPCKARPSVSSLTAAIKSPLFRRLSSSAGTTSTIATTTTVSDEIPSLTRTAPDTLKCGNCSTDLAFTSQIVSKGFTGRHGRAYLVAGPSNAYPFSSSFRKQQHNSTGKRRGSTMSSTPDNEIMNVRTGRSVNRRLVTGAHVVADVSCKVCGTVLGWRYVDAKEESQKYKIGKYILETMRVVKGCTWEDFEDEDIGEDVVRVGRCDEDDEEDDEVEFDSEDEDECDELFSGFWDGETVRRRRSSRR